MERTCFSLRLFPGTEEDFDRRHQTPPDELTDAIRRSGLSNLTVLRRGTDVWVYAECKPHAGEALAALRHDPNVERWVSSLGSVIAETLGCDGQLLRYEEIFHANGGGKGAFERGLFSLVVAPERVEDYDARHADPWPQMMEALATAGFHNYSGFRRGCHVIYYGEFYPDMATAVASIGATDVNRRWTESFEGVITTLTDAEGNLYTAHEVLHQD